MGVLKNVRSLAVLVFLLASGDAFPNGPPMSTCMTRFPKHGMDSTWQNNGASPYKITLSDQTYVPGQNITITIEADDGTKLMGVQISAHRKSVNVEEFMGTFVSYSPEDKLQAMSCTGVRSSQIGHKNNNPVDRVVLVWQAPAENVGDIIFKAALVKDYQTFWAAVTKQLNTSDPTSVVSPTDPVEVPTAGMDDVDFTRCGLDKGCFLYPGYCEGSDCDAAVTYTKNGDEYTFELRARSPGYVTMGISKDRVMGEDNTITCTSQGDIISVQNAINPGHFNERVLVQNLTNQRVQKKDSHVMCTFTRPRILWTWTAVPNTDPPKVNTVSFDLEENWHIMISWGVVPQKTDVMGKHIELPVVTDSQVNFQAYKTYRGSSMSRDVQAHGALMVVAWILFTGMAIVIARHYKDLLNGQMVLGAKIWFQVHRTVAFCVLLFTAISFIIIFVKLKELTDGAGEIHAIIGITVGVAVLLQVVAGMLRPAPDAKIRPVFRWGHRLLGQATHILAAANIYLAFNMRNTPKSMQHYGRIAVLVWIVVQVLWELVFEVWACRKSSSKGKGEITSKTGLNIQEPQKAPSSRVDQILLAVYFLTLVIFTIVILCGIFFF